MSAAVSNASQATTDKIKNASNDAQRTAHDTSDQASKQGEGLLNKASSLVSDTTQFAKQKAGLAQENVQSKSSELGDQAKDGSKQLQGKAENVQDEAKAGAKNVANESKETGSKLYEQATTLASNTVEYVKSAAGLTHAKAGEAKDRALSEVDNHATSNGGQTIGSLVNQARDLTGEALGTVKSYVASGQSKAQQAAGDVQEKAKDVKGDAEGKLNNATQSSYVDQARDLAASVIEQAQNVISTAGKKVEEKTDSNKPLAEQAGEAAKNVQDKVVDQASNVQSKTQEAVDSTSKNLEDLSLKGKSYVKAGANEVSKAAGAVSDLAK